MVQGVLGRRTRRALAMLAAAVVLTGGTITTLAAWQEQERIAGTVAASRLHLQVRSALLNGGAWTDVDATPGTLSFALPNATTLLSPSTTSSSFVEFRAAAGSIGADLSLSTSTVTGNATLAGVLQYGALGGAGVNATNCTSGGPLSLTNVGSSTLLAPLSALGANPGSGSGSLVIPAAPSATDGGTPVGVCLQIAFPSQALGSNLGSLVGNQSVSPTWTFLAQSRD